MKIETAPTVEEDIKVVTDAFLAGRPVPADVDARIAERAAEPANEFSESTANSTSLSLISVNLVKLVIDASIGVKISCPE